MGEQRQDTMWLVHNMPKEKQMTTEEFAIERFQDEPFFEVLIQSVARTATKYAYAKIKHCMTLGAGNTVDCIIREQALKTIEKLGKK